MMSLSSNQEFCDGGLELEIERKFTWKIKHFKLICEAKNDDLLNQQKVLIEVASTNHLPSTTWEVQLCLSEHSGEGDIKENWIGIFRELVAPTVVAEELLGASDLLTIFSIKTKNEQWTTPLRRFQLAGENYGWAKIYKLDKALGNIPFEADGSIVFDFTLQLYSFNAKPKKNIPQCQQSRLLAIDMAKLIDERDGLEDAKIISREGDEFLVHKAILRARSDFFKAMFDSNMKEANTGIVNLPDTSSKVVKALLRYIYTGSIPSLTTNESSTDDKKLLVSELIHVADKFNLRGLIAHLDRQLGAICTEGNAVQLLHLANKYSLEKAQVKVKKYITDKSEVLQNALSML